MKTCSKCGETKSIDQFRPDRGTCKSCYAKYRAEYRIKHLAKINARISEWISKNRDRVKARRAEYYIANAEKIKAYGAERYLNNKEKISAQQAEYYQKNADKEKARESARYRNNKERILKSQAEYYRKNREKIRATQAKYRLENKETIFAINHARRAKEYRSGERFTKKQIQELAVAQKYKCANPICRKSIKHGFHRDHMQPLSLGGSNDISNIQLLCEFCNLRKHAMPYEEWCRETGQLCLVPERDAYLAQAKPKSVLRGYR